MRTNWSMRWWSEWKEKLGEELLFLLATLIVSVCNVIVPSLP